MHCFTALKLIFKYAIRSPIIICNQLTYYKVILYLELAAALQIYSKMLYNDSTRLYYILGPRGFINNGTYFYD